MSDTSNASTPSSLDAAVSSLSYEQARSELTDIVASLEQGNLPLEESLAMWERGEALARRCEAWLDGAHERLKAARIATEAHARTTLSAQTAAEQEDTTEAQQ